ncbi:MAG: hypothetical protein HY060_02960 [Proteobacteria bacterium]|nr:hypothetical protein [Pseudomonadota bacterium]
MTGSRRGAVVIAMVVALAAAGSRAADVGESIKQGAQDTGAAIERTAKEVGAAVQERAEPAGQAIKQGAQQTGAAIEQGAHDTGNWLDRSTKGFRDGAESFFKKVGSLFSGDK